MANSGKDTNGSQFFVTVGPERHLDFNHTIFGQLVRGREVLTDINAVATDAAGMPTTTVVISDAAIVTNTTDTVLLIRPGGIGQFGDHRHRPTPMGTRIRSFTAQLPPTPRPINDPPSSGRSATGPSWRACR